MIENEKDIEKHLTSQARKFGGYALKWVCPSWTGVPDRIVILPGGRIGFIETKTTGKKPRPNQIRWQERLQSLGFLAFVADSKSEIDKCLEIIRQGG